MAAPAGRRGLVALFKQGDVNEESRANTNKSIFSNFF